MDDLRVLRGDQRPEPGDFGPYLLRRTRAQVGGDAERVEIIGGVPRFDQQATAPSGLGIAGQTVRCAGEIVAQKDDPRRHQRPPKKRSAAARFGRVLAPSSSVSPSRNVS